MTILLIGLLSITIICSISIVLFTIICGISPMPTSEKINLAILKTIKTYRSGDVVFDIGSGWGTLACAIARRFPHKTVIGIERSPVPYFFSKIINLIFCSLNCKLEYRDFFKGSLSGADVIVCYLCPSLMNRLEDKFEKELKDDTLVISSTFAVPNWEPVEIISIDDLYRSTVYVYRKTKKAE